MNGLDNPGLGGGGHLPSAGYGNGEPVVGAREKNHETYAALSMLRFLASWGVVFHHVFLRVFLNAAIVGNGDWWIANVVRSVTMLAVPLFLMVSGALFLNADRGITYTLRRVRSICIAYLLWSLVYLAIHVLFLGEHVSVPDALSRILRGQAEYHLYYVPIILGLYLAAAPAVRVFTSMSDTAFRSVVFGAWCFSFASWFIDDVLLRRSFLSHDMLTYWIRYAVLFLTGGLLWRTASVPSLARRTGLLIASAVYVAVGSVAVYALTVRIAAPVWDIWIDRYYAPHVIAASAAVFLAVRGIWPGTWKTDAPVGRLVEGWNRESFAVYLMHPLVLRLVTAVPGMPTQADSAAGAAALALVVGAVSFLFASVSRRCVVRWNRV